MVSKCYLCKLYFTTDTMKEINDKIYCENCLREVSGSFKYYIEGKEVSKEEYDKFMKGE